jgi:DNA repair protein RadC
MTQQIIAIAHPLGISVHDHIIVGKDGRASIKGLGLMWPGRFTAVRCEIGRAAETAMS